MDVIACKLQVNHCLAETESRLEAGITVLSLGPQKDSAPQHWLKIFLQFIFVICYSLLW